MQTKKAVETRQSRTTPELPSVAEGRSTKKKPHSDLNNVQLYVPPAGFGNGGQSQTRGPCPTWGLGFRDHSSTWTIHIICSSQTHADFSKRAQPHALSNGSAHKGRGPIILPRNTHIKWLSRVHEWLSFPVITPSLYTPGTCRTHAGPTVPKQPSDWTSAAE